MQSTLVTSDIANFIRHPHEAHVGYLMGGNIRNLSPDLVHSQNS